MTICIEESFAISLPVRLTFNIWPIYDNQKIDSAQDQFLFILARYPNMTLIHIYYMDVDQILECFYCSTMPHRLHSSYMYYIHMIIIQYKHYSEQI